MFVLDHFHENTHTKHVTPCIKFCQLVVIEVVAAIFAIVGAITGKLPKKLIKDAYCTDNFESFDKKACTYLHSQEASASFNIITAIVCAVCAVLMGISLSVSALYNIAKWPMKIANIACVVLSLLP